MGLHELDHRRKLGGTAQCRAQEGNLSPEQLANRQLGRISAGGPEEDDPPAGRGQIDQRFKASPSSAVDHHVKGSMVLTKFDMPVGQVVEAARPRTQFMGPLQFPRCAGSHTGNRPRCCCKLQSEQCCSGADAIDENAFVGLEPGPTEDRPIGSKPGQGQCRSLFPRQVSWLRGQLRGRNRNELGKGAIPRQPQNGESGFLGFFRMPPVEGWIENHLLAHHGSVHPRPGLDYGARAVRTEDDREF